MSRRLTAAKLSPDGWMWIGCYTRRLGCSDEWLSSGVGSRTTLQRDNLAHIGPALSPPRPRGAAHYSTACSATHIGLLIALSLESGVHSTIGTMTGSEKILNFHLSHTHMDFCPLGPGPFRPRTIGHTSAIPSAIARALVQLLGAEQRCSRARATHARRTAQTCLACLGSRPFFAAARCIQLLHEVDHSARFL